MAVLRATWTLCVNDQVVPLEQRVLAGVDPYYLNGPDFDEELQASLVHFKCTSEMTWLEKALEKPARWWVCNAQKIPLLEEIKTLIKAKKPKKGLPRNHKCLLALKVRGKIFYVVNNPHFVTLALTGHTDKARALLSFLDELQKDIIEIVYR